MSEQSDPNQVSFLYILPTFSASEYPENVASRKIRQFVLSSHLKETQHKNLLESFLKLNIFYIVLRRFDFSKVDLTHPIN